MAINTKASLRNYIKTMLGEPVINVELTDQQMDFIIDATIQKFSEFSAGGEEPKLFLISLVPEVFQYILDPRVKAIHSVRFKSNGFSYQLPGGMVIVPSDFFGRAMLPGGTSDLASVSSALGKISLIEQFFNIEPEYNFDYNSKTLTFYKDPAYFGAQMLLMAMMEYEPQEYDMIYNHQWVKDMCVAKSKFQWGSNVGKYDATLINGSKMNYERILSEAEADITRLDGELLTRWAPPLGLYRW